ncbi:NADH-quinone oxidoreductase subunit K [Rhodovulum marinum]|uniref:Multisubunit sodium/proton antiporter MrpC subunit n=1 Tax=Rhodovulum marinum TaxID=320662 RepID=A0A4R2PTJ4_9RHOB|nr:NADH-quinone oxidoreductase subunit K [Rhodovulum marinum]TCP39240.1 multisubunit sodium/proton antiporter MrpC subunit [Rhodovulum marinum]
MIALSQATIYGLAGLAVFGLGLMGVLGAAERLRRLIALNLCAAGAGMVLIAAAWRSPPAVPDPVPHALVITGIVVMVSATAVALALIRRLHSLETDTDD